MKILFVTAESVPFAKTGGLADVAFSLPKAIKEAGHDIRVIMPMYKKVIDNYYDRAKFLRSYDVSMNGKYQYAGIFEYENEGVTYYFLDNQQFFARDGLYGYDDDGERFAFFSKAVLDTICSDIFIPDVIHLNDWHTGPIALLLRDSMYKDALVSRAKSVFTIHNLGYQGVFPANMLHHLYGIDHSYLTHDKIEFHGNLNFAKAGIVFADMVTTVSRTYAHELRYPFFGEKLEGTISAQSFKMRGIVNGIDYDQFNPATDEHIFERYDVNNVLEKKVQNKIMFQRLLRMDQDPNIPMVGMVTRLVKEKGIDLVIRVINEMLDIPVQLVIIGTGDHSYENALKTLSNFNSNRLSANIYFDSKMASRIYAASDIFLMPSVIEPCGLSQMVAMRYGTIPLVRQTGGLMDTIYPYNKFEDSGNGFGFTNINAHDMLHVMREAVDVYHNDRAAWNRLILRAMNTDSTWNKSAGEYIHCYNEILNR